MTSFDLWPFDDVRSVERRGDLEVLQGTSPDGVLVTIIRVAPDVARDSALRDRFRQAVDSATRLAGPDDPPVLWADTATLVPWAATYDDPHRRGADLIAGIYAADAAGPAVQAQPGVPPQQPPVTYPTGQPGYGPPGAQQPYAPGAQPPVPGGPPVPPRKSRASRLAAFGAGGLVVVLLLGVAISLGLTREPEATGQQPTQSPVPSESIQFSTGPSATYTSATPTTPPKPKLKSVKPVSVYGPVWKAGEKTFTMDFFQLGWAFRAPGDFDCFVGEHTATKTKVTCTKLLDKKKTDLRGITILNRSCSGKSCSAAEQKTCATDVTGKQPKNLKRKDATTQYKTISYTDEKTKEKGFGLAMLHYYKGKSGYRNKCVLVYALGNVGEYAKQMQKTVNDIRSQTG